jgi:hypothetical protein
MSLFSTTDPLLVLVLNIKKKINMNANNRSIIENSSIGIKFFLVFYTIYTTKKFLIFFFNFNTNTNNRSFVENSSIGIGILYTQLKSF